MAAKKTQSARTVEKVDLGKALDKDPPAEETPEETNPSKGTIQVEKVSIEEILGENQKAKDVSPLTRIGYKLAIIILIYRPSLQVFSC